MPGLDPRLSGLILMDAAHGMILLRFDVLPTIKTAEGSHAMRHHNTVFHAVLKLSPLLVMARLVERSKANKKVRPLTTQEQFIALL